MYNTKTRMHPGANLTLLWYSYMGVMELIETPQGRRGEPSADGGTGWKEEKKSTLSALRHITSHEITLS
jgi:hypothetical protein